MPIDILRALAVKVNRGSGCLFDTSSDYTYVLTARHCIANLKTNEEIASFDKETSKPDVWTGEIQNESKRLEVLDYFISNDVNLDLAVIIVRKIDNLPSVNYSNIERGNEAIVYGYPASRAEEDDTRDDFTCTTGFESSDKHKFDLVSSGSLYSFNHSTLENTQGFSGSGVFKIHEDSVQLVGILTKLKNRDGSLNKLQAIKISEFNNLLSNQQYLGLHLKPLIPVFLTSFDKYIEHIFTFNDLNPLLTSIMCTQAATVTGAGITPKSIADLLNEKVFLPHKKGLSVDNPKLWKGWIEFLTYLSFQDNQDKFCNIPNSLIRPDCWTTKKYFYYLIDGDSWADAIRHLRASNKVFKSGSKFFVNTQDNSLSPPTLSATFVKRIVKNITNDEDTLFRTNGLEIHKDNIPAEYSFIRFQEFKDIFSNPTFAEIRDADELKEKIQVTLQEMLLHE